MTAGPVELVLVPGTLCDERLFAPQIAGLRDLASITVADLSRDDAIGAMAERILRSAPPRFALAGLSMGGIVAMEVVRIAAHRVERLGLMDTNPAADTEERRAGRDRHLARMRICGVERVMIEDIRPTYLASGNEADAEMLDTILAMAVRLGPDVFARQSRALAGRIDQTNTLRRTTCPSLVLCGACDRICPAGQHEDMARLLGNADCVVIERAGHLPTLERPEAVTASLRRWLVTPRIE